jgi:hypothetical protein
MSRSDISDVEYRLDKEGKDYHHHEGFAQLYRAEVSTKLPQADPVFKGIVSRRLSLIMPPLFYAQEH